MFQDLIRHVRDDLNAPFRTQTRSGLSVKYVKTLIKNMPRFVVEKKKKFEEKRAAIAVPGEDEILDSDLEVSLTRGEVFDLKMLRIAEVVVTEMQQCINTSDDNPAQVAQSAERSRKRRDERRIRGQKAYMKRNKKAQRIDA